MPEQNFLAPGPKQSEFNTLSSTVASLSEHITMKSALVSGTTNAYGELFTGLQVANIHSVISTRILDSNSNLLHCSFAVSGTGELLVVACNRSTNAPINAGSVSGTIYYT